MVVWCLLGCFNVYMDGVVREVNARVLGVNALMAE